LELAFETKALRTVCENEADADQEFGSEVAKRLRHRLADLHAAMSPEDLVAGTPHKVMEAGRPCIAINLDETHHLVLTANHPNNPKTASGSLDWSRVSRVRILRIESNV